MERAHQRTVPSGHYPNDTGLHVARELAVRLQSDIPAFAQTYFSPAELHQVQKLVIGRSGRERHDLHWVESDIEAVRGVLSFIAPDNPNRAVLEKLSHGLERANTERRFKDATQLGDALFAREHADNRWVPIDLALARVEEFRHHSAGGRPLQFGIELTHALARFPGRFIPHAPSEITSGTELGIALWGERPPRVHDHIDLVSKITHLQHLREQLDRAGLYRDEAIYQATGELRTQLLTSVDYLRGDTPRREARLYEIVAVPQLQSVGCRLSCAEQLLRIAALRDVLPEHTSQLDRHTERIRNRLDVGSQEHRLQQVSIRIDALPAHQIRLTAANPLRDEVFRHALSKTPLHGAPDRLEVGGMLFGRVEAGNVIRITRVVPYERIEFIDDGGIPSLRLDIERERARIASLERRGHTFLGDWHLHPPDTSHRPSARGDSTIHRALLGERLLDSRITVQIIVQTDNTPAGTRLYPYVYHPFRHDREVRPSGFTRALFAIHTESESVPALVEPRPLTESPLRIIDRLQLRVWERASRAHQSL